MSCGASRLSKSIEALISSIMASGPPSKRPPHMALEASASGPAGLTDLGFAWDLVGAEDLDGDIGRLIAMGEDKKTKPGFSFTLLAALAAGLAGFAAVYGTFPLGGNAGSVSGAATPATAPEVDSAANKSRGVSVDLQIAQSTGTLAAILKPLQTGQMVKFVVRETPVDPGPGHIPQWIRRASRPERLEGPRRAGQPLGDMVCAVP